MSFWQWLKTASGNATADLTINWSEGMAPSSVNDSGRAMMAVLAQYRDDISGSLTTGGIATAYTLTTNQGLASTPATGQLIAFVPNLTNGIAPTLTCDGGTAYPIQSATGVSVGAATLVAGTPYTAMFGGSAWLLRNIFGNPFNIPLGGMMPYLGATAPNANFALPFGQAISRTTYATLFAMASTTFGAGDGTTTFNIPDLRGATIAGLGNMGGVDAGRITVAGGNFDGTVLGATGGAQNQTLTTPQIPVHSHPNTATGVLPRTGILLTSGVLDIPASGGAKLDPTAAVDNPAVTVTMTNANAGGGLSHPIMQYTMVLPMILRII